MHIGIGNLKWDGANKIMDTALTLMERMIQFKVRN